MKLTKTQLSTICNVAKDTYNTAPSNMSSAKHVESVKNAFIALFLENPEELDE